MAKVMLAKKESARARPGVRGVRRGAGTASRVARPAARAWGPAVRASFLMPSNHRRWEQQADAAAAQVSRGGQGAARRLSPAPASALTLPTSTGQPLPGPLRTRLEQGFGAGLSAVRLHTGPAAGDAAAGAQALAFTAGSHIYFAAGAYRPDGESGFRLLAHEVAHVLQQTGRATADGRLRATHASGPGQPQLKGEGKAYRTLKDIVFETLVKKHRAGGRDKELERVITTAASALKIIPSAQPSLDHEDGALKIEKGVLAKAKDFHSKSGRANAFLFDLLKLTDCWQGASALLDRDPLLQTAFPVFVVGQGGITPTLALIEYYNQRTGGPAWFNTVASRHPVLGRYWPKTYLDSIWDYLIGPTRAIPTLAVYGKKSFPEYGIQKLGGFADAQKQYLQNWDQTRGLKDNELVPTSFFILELLDSLRTHDLAKITKEVDAFVTAKSAARLVTRRIFIAEKVVKWGQLVQKVQPAVLTGPLGEEITALGKRALDFWKGVNAIQELTFSRSRLKDVQKANPEAVIRLVPGQKALAVELPRALSKAAGALFKLSNDPARPGDKILPDRTTYGANIKAAAAPLLKFAQQGLEIPLLQLLRKPKVDENLALVYAWFMERTYTFIQFIESYDPELDKKYVEQWGVADLRLAHRLQAAQYLSSMAFKLSGEGQPAWDGLNGQIQAVLANREQGKSALALVGDWKLDRKVPIKTIGSEFKVIHYKDVGNVPAGLLANLLLILYHQDVITRLRQGLRAAEPQLLDPDLDTEAAVHAKPVMQVAFEAADKVSRPMRYGLRPLEYARNPTDVQALDQTQGKVVFVEEQAVFNHLMKNHPKTIAAQQAELDKGRKLLDPESGYGEAFFWSLPDLLSLLPVLRADEVGLNELIAAAMNVRVETVKAWSNPLDWFKALVKLPEDALYGLAKNTRTNRLEPEIRRAVNHQRRLIGRLVREKLPEYTGRALDTDTYDLPLVLLDLIEGFARWVDPPKDRFPQMAALFLDVAPALKEAFANRWHPEGRYFIITGYLGYILLAMSYATGKNQGELARVTTSAELARLLKNQDDLKITADSLKEARRKRQTRFGFESVDRRTFTHPNHGYAVEPDVPFRLDGVMYNLLEVNRKFSYHPAYGIKPMKGSPEGAGGYSPPILTVEGKRIEVGPQAPDLILFTIVVAGRKVQVTPRDEETLTRLSHVIEMRIILIGLEKLNELMESAVDLALDAAEFIPGVGQVIAAARIVGTLVKFFSTGEFQQILEELTENPVQTIKKIAGEISERVQPEGMWDFLLFGSPLFDWLMQPVEPTRTRSDLGGKGSRLSKVIAKLRGLRVGMGKAMRLLFEKVQMPLHAFEAVVQAHPFLAAAVSWTAHNLAWLVSLVREAPETIRDIREWFKNGKEVFYTHLQGLLNGLAGLELPEQVLPLKEATHAVIDLILGRFKTKGKIIRALLNKTGAMDQLTGEVESLIVHSQYDPNQIWVDTIRPPLEEKFIEVRDALSGQVYTILHDQLGLDVVKPEGAKKEEVSPQFEGEEGFAVSEAEALGMQGYQAEEPDPLEAASLPRPSGGEPLTVAERAQAEAHFGQDFSHVRLHRGQAAGRSTGVFAAQGLASGSHIFLRPGLSTGSEPGRKIFYHELAHVVQQTGPRPLGIAHNRAPFPGAPGKALRVDPAQERAADQAASGPGGPSPRGPAPRGRSQRDPLLASSTPDRGEPAVQPAGLSIRLMRKLLNQLSDIQSAEKHRARIEDQIDQARRKGQKADVPPTELQIAQAIWQETRASLLDPKPGDLPATPVLTNKQDVDLLKTYLTFQLDRNIAPGVAYIAQSALVTKRRPKDAPKDSPRLRQLHIPDFARFLQQYILAMSGAAVSIALHDIPANRSMPSGGWVKRVQITNLLLVLVPYTGSGKELWDRALRSFPKDGNLEKLRRIARGPLRAAGAGRWIATSEDEQDGAKLTNIVPIWDTKEFKFSDSFAKYVERLSLKIKITKETLPPFDRYTDYDRKDSAAEIGAGGVIGLRIGKYGDANQKGTQEGNDRESHHTTQWLLIEYFRHQTKDFVPFRQDFRDTWKTLGVTYDSRDKPKGFTHSKGPVDFASLDDDQRGDPMPAILLAVTTHQSGKLHIRGSKGEDLGGKGKTQQPTQGKAVDTVFQRELFTGELAPYRGRAAAFSQGKALHTARDFADFAQANKGLVQDRIYSALQATYKDMYDQMLPALEKALPGIELSYYESVEEAKEPESAAEKDERSQRVSRMDAVFKAARSNNNAVMRKYGWIE